MNEFLNKLIMYHQIHKMSRDGWSKTRISEFLGINWRTVSKYLDMSEEEFLAYIEAQGNRQKVLAPYEGFVKIKLEQYPDTKAAQMHDWLKEHYEHFPEVTPKTVYNFVMWVRQQHNIPLPDSQREFCIVEELPFGKQAQVDFGEYNMRDGQGKRVRNGEDNMIMIDRISMIHSLLDPKRLVGTLTLGTVAIATTIVTDLIAAAKITLVLMTAFFLPIPLGVASNPFKNVNEQANGGRINQKNLFEGQPEGSAVR